MSPSELLLQIPLYALVIGVPAWALISGGRAEKISALIFVFATLATNFVGLFSVFKNSGTIILLIDGVMALSYLALALIYGYLWISLMMFAMSGFFAIHAYFQMLGRALDPTFALASNLATVVLLTSLAIGVWTSRHRRADGA